MVETISPVVHGGRARWLGALALHTLGATGTAALFGAGLGWIGAALDAPWQRPGLLALAALSALYALGALTRLRLPVPQLRRQVPDWWRTFFGRPFAAVLYGAGLGIGFMTYLSNGTLVVVAFAAAASGRPMVGAVVVGPFGLVRGLSAIVSWRSITQEQSRALVDRLVAASGSIRRTANGVVLVLIALVAVAASGRVAAGSWWAIGAAALASVFAWAAVSKVAGSRRWMRALAVYGLPPGLGRTAAWAVPAAEAFVPALVIAGLPRIAALWSVLLLAGFSLALVRARRRVGGRVPCGCLGGRDTVDVNAALARNLALILTAVFVVARASDAPVIVWPGVPRAGDMLPLTLAFGALVASALVAWRSSAWLVRGRRA
ncbi:MAG: MauE/DoxX family redox-associated membrane protein [Actinomycetota bacterium]